MLHSLTSPSSASRWVKCTGSLALIERFPVPYTPTPALERGTRLHNVAREYFNSKDPKALARHFQIINDYDASDIYNYYAYIKELFNAETAKGKAPVLIIEQKVNIEAVYPNMFGTPDIVLYTDDALHIVDLKTGRLPVSAVDNPQLMLYAYGAICTYGLQPRNITLHIYQNGGGAVNNTNLYTLTPSHLNVFIEGVESLLSLYRKGILRYKTGEQCQYCPVSQYCPARIRHILELFTTLSGQEYSLDMLDTGSMVRMLHIFKDLAPFIGSIQAKLLDTAPGELKQYNLVIRSKKNPAKYRDSEGALQALKDKGVPEDDIAPRVLLTPAQLKKKAQRYYEYIEEFLEPQTESRYLAFQTPKDEEEPEKS